MEGTSVLAWASTLATTGQRGSDQGMVAKAASRSSATGRMRAQWKGALTFKGITLEAPFSLARTEALSTAGAAPERTICPGAL